MEVTGTPPFRRCPSCQHRSPVAGQMTSSGVSVERIASVVSHRSKGNARRPVWSARRLRQTRCHIVLALLSRLATASQTVPDAGRGGNDPKPRRAAPKGVAPASILGRSPGGSPVRDGQSGLGQVYLIPPDLTSFREGEARPRSERTGNA